MRRNLLKRLIIVTLALASAVRADAQSRDDWEVSVVPFYFWAAALDGELTAGPRTVPLFLKFSDAADKLAAAYAFHVEASKGRWGVLTDLNFFQLSSSAAFTVLGRPIEGTFDLDNVMFELGGSYLVNESARLAVIGGLRTYTVSPLLEFRTPTADATPIDTSETSANVFVGFVARPRISDRWTFIGRGDIGGGADLTWSGLAGLGFRVAPWGDIEFGFKALGIDIKTDDEDRVISQYSVTHYGPIFGFRLHWGR